MVGRTRTHANYIGFFGDFEKQNASSLRLEREYMAQNKTEYEAATRR
jgi:hypothetical protein